MPVGRVIAANLSASECAWRHGDWGLVSAASVFFPTRAARAAPALNQLRHLGFSFLNFFSFWVVTRRNCAAMFAVASTDNSKDKAVVAVASRMVQRFAAPFLAGLC